eukprot:527376_1
MKRKKTRRKRSSKKKGNTEKGNTEKENIEKDSKNNKTRNRKRKSVVLTETDDNLTEFDGDTSTFECSYAATKQQNETVVLRQSKRKRHKANYNDNDYQYINSLFK